MHCQVCGAEVPEGTTFCPNCGSKVDSAQAANAPQQQQYVLQSQQPPAAQPASGQPQYSQPQYQQPQYAQQPPQPQPQYAQPPYQQPQYVNDSGSFGWAVLGFFIPLVGLILYLVWKNEKPLSAKKAGVGALVGFIVSLLLSLAGGCASLSVLSYYY